MYLGIEHASYCTSALASPKQDYYQRLQYHSELRQIVVHIKVSELALSIL